jgi:hypothetical protein
MATIAMEHYVAIPEEGESLEDFNSKWAQTLAQQVTTRATSVSSETVHCTRCFKQSMQILLPAEDEDFESVLTTWILKMKKDHKRLFLTMRYKYPQANGVPGMVLAPLKFKDDALFDIIQEKTK